jgi:hypothetical protein
VVSVGLSVVLVVEAGLVVAAGDFALKLARLARRGVANCGAGDEEESGDEIDSSSRPGSEVPAVTVGMVMGAVIAAPVLPSQA